MGTKRTVERRGSYEAVDAQGNRHTIDVYVEVLHIEMLSEPTQRQDGLQSHKMRSNGGHVNVNAGGELEEVATGAIMRRV